MSPAFSRLDAFKEQGRLARECRERKRVGEGTSKRFFDPM
jgi:hypothetical protein